MPRGDSTLNERVRLQPFGVHITEVYFYFPFDGDYDWFPACLSSNKKMMAMASPQRIKVCSIVKDIFMLYETSVSMLHFHTRLKRVYLSLYREMISFVLRPSFQSLDANF